MALLAAAYSHLGMQDLAQQKLQELRLVFPDEEDDDDPPVVSRSQPVPPCFPPPRVFRPEAESRD